MHSFAPHWSKFCILRPVPLTYVVNVHDWIRFRLVLETIGEEEYVILDLLVLEKLYIWLAIKVDGSIIYF